MTSNLPPHEVRAIINHVVGHYIRLEDCTLGQIQEINHIIQKRMQGMPLAKIIGYKEFWRDRFMTNMHTLDPRPDSETLIEAVLETCPQAPYRILDLGTGSGCLLLSLLGEYPQATGVGVDISPDALDVAKRNSEQLGLSERVDWVQSDWCANVSGEFDIIISNPPYIGRDEAVNIGATYDPDLALYGGVHTYQVILASIESMRLMRREKLRTVQDCHPWGDVVSTEDPSYIFFEVGYQQSQLVAGELKKFGYQIVGVKKDLAGYERVVVGKR